MTERRALIRTVYTVVLLLTTLAMMGIVALLQSKTYIFKTAMQSPEKTETQPFPVGVNRYTEEIFEQPLVDTYFDTSLAQTEEEDSSWQSLLATLFSTSDWYQSLASPVSRILVIWPGERHEEIVKEFGDILRWDEAERTQFASLIQAAEPTLKEGKFSPGKYVAHRYATPEEVSALIHEEFSSSVLDRYTLDVARHVPLADAITIASLIEREASDFSNMREVSGVIWNRLFIDMPLQLDATLQYVRGSRPYEPRWWPVPHPQDKYIDSPYNTYQNKGLPPGPIANPSPEAILAALNPVDSDCLYYFHDDHRNFYCSASYEEHVRNLKRIFGQGR